MQEEMREVSDKSALTAQTLANRFESETKELRETHETTLTQLRKELEKQRTDFQQLSSLMIVAESKRGRLQQNNEHLVRCIQKLRAQLKSLRHSVDKEKRLVALEIASKRTAIESEFHQKMDELTTKTEAEKRRLYGFAVDAFHCFFNPKEEISERSFRTAMTQARIELDRLTASDQAIRRLLDADETQATEDDVACLLLPGN